MGRVRNKESFTFIGLYFTHGELSKLQIRAIRRIGGSAWIKLYKKKGNSITIYSEESDMEEGIPMEEFNAIVDHFIDNGCGHIHESDIVEALGTSTI